MSWRLQVGFRLRSWAGLFAACIQEVKVALRHMHMHTYTQNKISWALLNLSACLWTQTSQLKIKWAGLYWTYLIVSEHKPLMEVFRDVQWCCSDAPLVPHWCSTGTAPVLHWCSIGAPLALHWCSIGAPLVLHWHSTSGLLVPHWCSTSTALVLHWRSTSAHLALHWCSPGAPLVLHR